MKKTAFAFLLSLAWSLGFSQNRAQTIDSLKHEIGIGMADTSRVLAMDELALNYQSYKPDSSIHYAQQALILARKIKYPKGEFWALFRLGFLLGMAGNYPRALEMQLKALRIAEKNNFLLGKAQVWNRFGNIYRDAGDYSKAVVFHQRARLLFDSLQYHDQSAGAQNLLSTDYFLMNKTDSAQYYAQLAYETTNRWKVEWMRSPNFLMMGRLQSKLGNFPLALDYFQKSAHDAHVRQAYFYSTQAYLEIARIYQQTNQPDSCVIYAQKALADAQKGNLYQQIGEASLFLSSLYEQKNAPLALQYQQTALAAKDSLSNFGNLTAIQNQVAFDEEERQYEIETAHVAWHNKARQVALLAGLGMVLLVSFILFRNNRQKQKANAVLEKTLSNLKSTQSQLIQSEKLASLGELTAGIAHEIQNPLNFVNNFSELSVDLAEELKLEIGKLEIPEKDKEYVGEILGDLTSNQQKINHHGKRAAAIVTGMLQHARTSTGKKEPTDLNALADEYLRLSYHGLRAKDSSFNANMVTDFDPAIGKVEVIPQDIGRVFLNIINNAFYATQQRQKQAAEDLSGFKNLTGLDSYEPTVSVSSRLVIPPSGGQRGAEFRIKDNGTGIPGDVKARIFQPFFTTKPTGQGTGLGLSLAYDIVVKGHGGTLGVESEEGEGTTFIVKLPTQSI